MSRLFIDGFALWPPAPGAPRPQPSLLGANERRRAPDSVLIALAVAEAAVQQAGIAADSLASVFTSAHGDLAIVDALCRTLAADPLLLSPTRFHHSVHNAASGYWAIGARCHETSTALAAFDHSFGAGWMEAVAICEADDRPVLLVGAETEARGALATVSRSRGLFGVALVLTPRRGPASRWQVETSLQQGALPAMATTRNDLAANAMANALPLFDALGAGQPASITLALGPALGFGISLLPVGTR